MSTRSLLLLVTALSALPRLIGAVGDLWWDEVWSLHFASEAGTVVRVFTAIHHDNNHYLNTLWLLLLGEGAPAALLRLPALVAGVATVWLLGRVDGGGREGLLAAGLVGLSYPFVNYASEARGYALAGFMALAAYALLSRHLEGRALHRASRSAAAFAIVACLGILSHLTFVAVFISLVAWSVLRLRRVTGGWRDVMRSLAALHAPPLALLALLWVADLRWLGVGGGPDLSPLRGWVEAWTYAFGLPTQPPLSLLALAALLVPVVVRLEGLRRRSDETWIFFLLVLLLPFAPLIAFRVTYAPPRYFLVSVLFGLLLFARGAGGLLRRGGRWRLVAAALVAVFLLGNVWRTSRFLAHDRGGYRDALLHIVAASEGDTVRVSGDYDRPNQLLLERFARDLAGSTAVVYIPRARIAERPPEWYMATGVQAPFRPPPVIEPVTGIRYALRAAFSAYGISGLHWAVYRRVSGTTAGPPRPRSDVPARSASLPVPPPRPRGSTPPPAP